MITNNRIPKSVLILLSLFLFNFIWGAKAPSSKKELETLATHIVVGKVQAVYSYKDREGIRLVSDYEYDHKVAEVKIEKVEKGKVSEKLIYVRYWSRKWKGIVPPPPGGQSYENQPKKDQTCRFYLARNAYDGWSRQGNNDGGYNVVYVNGIQPIDK